ncbi:MAG: hypothetical protein JW791_01850 [Nanoarchaeota archaeon]|nr:hypothetical protein [Nanoarchaeota archaeon]
MLSLPSESKELIRSYAEDLMSELEYYNDFEDKLNTVLNYLASNYSYGLREAMVQKKPIRYPHEIKRFVTCFEAGVLSYLVLKELGYHASLKVFEMQNSNDIASFEYVDHTVVELSDNGKKYYFDLVNLEVAKVKKEVENKIFFKNDFNKVLTFKSLQVIDSLEDLVSKMDYLQGLEGKVEALTQKYRVDAQKILNGMIRLYTYFQYDKEKEEFNTNAECYIANHLNLKINVKERVFQESGEVIFKGFYDVDYPAFTLSKQKLDEAFNILKLSKLVKNKDFWPNDLTARLVLGIDLPELSKSLNASLEQITGLHEYFNQRLDEDFNSIDASKNMFFLNICMMNDYFTKAKNKSGKTFFENYYNDSQIITGIKKLVRKAKNLSSKVKSLEYNVRMKRVTGRDWKNNYKKYYFYKKRFEDFDDYIMSLDKLMQNKNRLVFTDMDTSIFKDEIINKKIIEIKKSLKKNRFVEVKGEKVRVNKKNFDKIYNLSIHNWFLNQGCSSLNGFKELAAGALAKYFYLRPNIKLVFIKNNAFSIIKEFKASQAQSL